MAFACLLCHSSINPGNRAFLKQKEHLVKQILNFLDYEENKDAEKFIENQFVCRGKCLGNLNRLVKLRKELSEVEKEVRERIRPAIEDHLCSMEPVAVSGARTRSSRDTVTPTRQVVKQMVSNESPVVSVSCLYSIYV